MFDTNSQSANEIGVIIHQHLEDAAFSWQLRDKAVSDPHYSLADLSILDARIEAHIDGIVVAGDAGWNLCSASLDSGESGDVFVAAILAFESDDGERLAKALSVAAGSLELMRGLISALGWIGTDKFDRWIPALLGSDSPMSAVGAIAGLAVRREEMEHQITGALGKSDTHVKARALRAIGEVKQLPMLSQLRRHLQSDDESCRLWAAWSSVLLGDKAVAESLKTFVNFNTSFAYRAIQLAPRVLDSANAQQWLRGLAQDEATRRYALIGCGVTGNPVYIPTLISQMSEPIQARVAGEAFSMITGVDLAYDDLDTDQPEGFEAGPTEDPADENVDLDPDEDLPWPNQELIQKWWNEHGRAYQPGARYLCGQPMSRENCRRVLIEGFQRQRIAAALELALLNPDEPLFEWRAPGWRQQEWLGLRKPRRRSN